MKLTGMQIQYLNDMMGGEYDSEGVTIDHREAHTSDEGEQMPEGLYAWFTEYPEEGYVWLPRGADEYRAHMAANLARE